MVQSWQRRQAQQAEQSTRAGQKNKKKFAPRESALPGLNNAHEPVHRFLVPSVSKELPNLAASVTETDPSINATMASSASQSWLSQQTFWVNLKIESNRNEQLFFSANVFFSA